MKPNKKPAKADAKTNKEPRLKQLVMAFHPASCRSIQNTILQLRNDLARNVA